MLVALVLLFIFSLIWFFCRRNDKKIYDDVSITFHKHDVDVDVVIVGAGPVGMLLANSLIKQGLRVKILEKRKDRSQFLSRAIGIHPPSLQIFEKIDPQLVQTLKQKSVCVNHAVVLGNDRTKVIGELNIELCNKPFNFILACPQSVSENALEESLHRTIQSSNCSENGTIRSAKVVGIDSKNKRFASVKYEISDGTTHEIKCHFVVGCDGKNSFVRSECGIKLDGRSYFDTFLMGDFSDNTSYGQSAAIFLGNDFMVECFPLPNGVRRWVCSTETQIEKPDLQEFCGMVKKRTLYDISKQENFMLSSYGVHGFVAQSMYDHSHRVILAGDAAHQCSPLGGQGMNLGWDDAWNLSLTIKRVINGDSNINQDIHEYDKIQRRKALAIIHRAEFNMILGRKPSLIKLRNYFVKTLLASYRPVQTVVAKYFTMRYIGNVSFGRFVGV
ncbi:hypothetical protein AKO1_014301 [Acrasis kona]|uniref:FAD-binding domain-containing protein n=1 Tax=Acrasis kona TaxID=1008807 RepID=A0AAW2YZI8_9EUKA